MSIPNTAYHYCKGCGEQVEIHHGPWPFDGVWQHVDPAHNVPGHVATPDVCENAECGNSLTFDDVQAGDGLCSYCAENAESYFDEVAEIIDGSSIEADPMAAQRRGL